MVAVLNDESGDDVEWRDSRIFFLNQKNEKNTELRPFSWGACRHYILLLV